MASMEIIHLGSYHGIGSARKLNYYTCTITNHAMKWLSKSHYKIEKNSVLSWPFNDGF